ncbi:MAG: HAMP domain-containing sensor histidine kinase [Clostridiales bacterium]
MNRKYKKHRNYDNKDFSLVVKMNSRLLWRLFRIFLTLDMVFLLLFSVFLIYRAEESFSQINIEINNANMETAVETDNKTPLKKVMVGSDYLIENKANIEGWKIPNWLIFNDDAAIANAPRCFVVENHNVPGFYGNMKHLSYGIYFKDYAIKYNIGDDLRLLTVIFAIVLILEGFTFLTNIRSGARLIRNSLKPIYEIEKATRIIQENTSLSELSDLTGRINKIEAKSLSSRISVDSAQEELKGLSDAINDLLERIEIAYRSQARFVSDASHELRTPISVIQGYVNLLDRWGKNDEKTLQESIDAIKNEADSMKDLIEQLLFLARGDNEAMPLRYEVFNLSILAEEVYQESQMIDKNHQINFSGSENIMVNADMPLIKQALRIFIDNSIKYSPPNEKISVKVEKNADFGIVKIQDNGIGIIPDDLPYIFDRFYRSDDSRARKTGGTGLGLAIGKWIVHRHGGHLEVLSRKDFGTRITVYLPLYKENNEGNKP